MLEGRRLCLVGNGIVCTAQTFSFRGSQTFSEVCGDELIIRAKAYAKSVEVINGEDDLLLEDNYFDMNGGEKKVKILAGRPEKLKVRSVFDIH